MRPIPRLLVQSLAVLLAVVSVAAVTGALLEDAAPSGVARRAAAPQDLPGPVLLVPGYGGSTRGLEVLATALRDAGRDAVVVRLPGDGRGDLRASAQVLAAAADAAVAGGAPSVDVVGYSAGGVVARLWAAERPEQARRVVTLGSPHHGAELAALGAAFSPGACPVACQQLVPGSDLLDELNEDDETPEGPQWLAIWTTQDEVVTPPASARLDGAVNVALQELCPGIQVDHGALPTHPVVQTLVLQAISLPDVKQPASCPTS